MDVGLQYCGGDVLRLGALACIARESARTLDAVEVMGGVHCISGTAKACKRISQRLHLGLPDYLRGPGQSCHFLLGVVYGSRAIPRSSLSGPGRYRVSASTATFL